MIAIDTLSASLEDYLEAIFHIIAEKQAVRAKDISKRLKVGGSSVTGALRALHEKGLINYAPYDVITLTQEGEATAKDVIRRHEVLRDFFVDVLAVDEPEADVAACRMEHSIPKVILEKFIQFAEFIELCPRGGAGWIESFRSRCAQEGDVAACNKCVSENMSELSLRQKSLKPVQGLTLCDLKQGQRARIVSVESRKVAGGKMLEMGVVPGSIVEIESLSHHGDVIEIKIKGYHESLRKDEACGIDIEII